MAVRLLSSVLLLISGWSLGLAQSEPCKSVEVPVGIVNSNGESFRGLSSAEFSGHAGKTVVVVKSMTLDDGPRRVILIVDTSKKLSADTRKAEQVLVETILNSARPQDTFALVTARGPEKTINFGEQRDAFVQAIPLEVDSRRGGKDAGVLDAAMKGLELFGSPKAGDSMILIAADLEGNRTTNAKRVAKALQEHHVRMFGLALGPVSTANASLSGQTTTSAGLSQITPIAGVKIYDTGDEDFYPVTRNSGGMVMGVMNADYRQTYSMKDPKFEARVKQQAQALFNMIAVYYRIEVEPHPGDWSLEPSADVRKAVPSMFLLYPRELGSCSSDPHVAKK